MEPITINKSITSFFEKQRKKFRAVTFDDITCQDLPSSIHPNSVDLTTHITKNIKLKGCGIMSAAMDTVTEGELALSLAKVGGIGIIHRNLSIEEQVNMVKWVRHKIHYRGMIEKPITFKNSDRLSDIEESINKNGWTFTSFPILDSKTERLVGLLTRDETKFVEETNPHIKDIMKPITDITTCYEGTTTQEAYKIMRKSKIKKLPVITKDKKLIGMYVWNDLREDTKKENTFSLDDEGHFLVGASIGIGSTGFARAEKLVQNGCRLLVIDTSHGACKPVVDIIQKIKSTYIVDIIAGNVASYESAKYLLSQKHIPDGIKVGISIGASCTTRQVTGHGMPQLTAIYETKRAIKELNLNIPIIADGGIRYSGDIVKALAVGASGFMIGSKFAATLESCGKLVEYDGKKYKTYRGMGSQGAMNRAGSRDRYYNHNNKFRKSLTQEQQQKVTPEGIEGLVKYTGTCEQLMNKLLGGIRAGLAHSDGNNIEKFRQNIRFWLQSHIGSVESKPHDMINIKS